jgi:hypothetical protein
VPLLSVVPFAWCAASWATLHTLGAWEAWIPAAAIAVALPALVWRRHRKGATSP